MSNQTTLRPQARVLLRLQQGPATSGELALEIYLIDDEWTRSCIHTVITRLRKRGIGITLDAKHRFKPRYYRLAHDAECPYCNGTGKLNKVTLPISQSDRSDQ